MTVAELFAEERERFEREHPRSRALAERAASSLLGGVPMHWMVRWPGGFPVYAAEAEGARFRDVDGLEYVDFCLGDTGAMTGHSPGPTVRAGRPAPVSIAAGVDDLRVVQAVYASAKSGKAVEL